MEQAPAVHTKSKTPMREFVRKGKPPTEDYREKLFELEAKGELEVHRVPDPIMEVGTKYGRTKKIPLEHTWHHKSCG
ncbi:MAG: heterodisulfide reductase subunit B, partial [Candidatus Marinimicrobia bacterium]|nr:heterodisulfide reductase subunit B [Candidatus Neomarinimicrobiota bacterium]HJM86101.1 heterodisulfide reductase subunit B [Candidatus Neomarinimicrobiota bacterium]